MAYSHHARAAVTDMLVLLLPLAILVGVGLGGHAFSDSGVVLTVLGLALAMSAGLWLHALARRRMLLASCLVPASGWRHRLRGGVLSWLVAMLRALPLALILVVAVVRGQTYDPLLMLFVANAPVLVLLRNFWQRQLAGDVVPGYLPFVAGRIAMQSNLGVLLIVLVAFALNVSYPDFAGVALRDAILHEAGRQQADSAVMLAAMQLAAAKDALSWWLGQQFLPGTMQPILQFVGWVVLLATDVLVLWSYLVLCSSTLYLFRRRVLPPI